MWSGSNSNVISRTGTLITESDKLGCNDENDEVVAACEGELGSCTALVGAYVLQATTTPPLFMGNAFFVEGSSK